MRNTIGVDKIKIYSREFRLKKHHEFTIEQKVKQGQDVPVRALDMSGNPIHATKLYCNEGELANYTITDRGLSIEFNPSKHYHEYHLSGIDKLGEALPKVQSEAQRMGLVCSLENSIVGRLDLARQEDMSETFGAYSQVFQTLKAKRGKHRNLGSTYTMGNRLHQLCFYSKSEQFRELHKIDLPEINLMRCEARFMRGKSVKHHIGENRLEWLLGADSKQLSASFGKYVNRYLDNRSGKQLAISFEQEAKHMMQIKEQVGRNWFLYWIITKGSLESVALEFGGWENIAVILRELGENRMQISRYRDKFQEIAALPRQELSNDAYMILLNELRLKFAA